MDSERQVNFFSLTKNAESNGQIQGLFFRKQNDEKIMEYPDDARNTTTSITNMGILQRPDRPFYNFRTSEQSEKADQMILRLKKYERLGQEVRL